MRSILLLVTLSAVVCPVVQADDAKVEKLLKRIDQLEQTVDRVSELEREVARLKGQQHDEWLKQRQSDAYRQIVDDVIQDAEARSSQEGVQFLAGFDGKSFVLVGPEGNNKMVLGGQFQFRFIASNQDKRPDETESGFQMRRFKLGASGHVITPDLFYKIVFEGSRVDGKAGVEDAYFGYKFSLFGDKDANIKVGKTKIPFLREELTSSRRQLGIDRSSVTEFFTTDRAELIQLEVKGKNSVEWNLKLAVHDGADTEFSEFTMDPVEIGLAARIDIALKGSLGQGKDFNAWSGEDDALLLGGAVIWQLGDADNTTDGGLVTGGDFGSDADADYLGWTVDLGFESNGVSIFGALMGGHIDPDVTGASDRDMMGYLIQGGVFLVPDEVEAFIRYECIDGDIPGEDEAYLLTFGVNWYKFKQKHNHKITAEIIWFFDGDVPTANPFGNSPFSNALGLGGGTVDDEELIAFLLQWQLLF